MSNEFDFFAGIDLGTTNSAVAIAEVNGRKLNTPVIDIDRLVNFQKGGKSRKRDKTLPSAVMYNSNENGEYDVYVGDCAREMAKTRPYAVAQSVKEQMGLPHVTYPNWKAEYPDQTPEEVSARIISAVLDGVEDAYGERPSDAVITVPANYSTMKRTATLRAAEKAGLQVRDNKGGYREDILLSEPEAVIYNVLNQQQNGDLSLKCDFSVPRNVMVYDIGGGTLDITVHTVQQAKDNPDTHIMKLIATNRYSDMAGNTIDRAIADYMYQCYLDDEQPALLRQAQQSKDQDRPYFERMAEEVKISFSDQVNNRKKRGAQLPLDASESYGCVLPGGRGVESSITRGEMEKCLEKYMGKEYQYEDYRNFDSLPEKKDILYPVLQVLSLAEKKQNKSGLQLGKIDLVILNGGMSRLYLVRDRLTEFFGFPMTVVSDPDTSVAQGAAVYHYNRSINAVAPSEIVDDDRETSDETSSKIKPFHVEQPVEHKIISAGTVLNESIYLGLAGGATILLAEAGEDLPYERDDLPPFSLSAGVDQIEIPLRERHGKQDITIGRGRIYFGRTCRTESEVHVKFRINRSGILSLEAYSQIGSGSVEILLGEGEQIGRRGRGRNLTPPAGTDLIPDNELSRMKSLVSRLDALNRSRNPGKKRTMQTQIRESKENMLNAGNPEAFAASMLKMMKESNSENLVWNLLPVARFMCRFWSEQERKQLSAICRTELGAAFSGIASNNEINRNIEAIKTIGVCGVAQDCSMLRKLHSENRYLNALLYAYGAAGIQHEWIFDQLKFNDRLAMPIQDELYAMGTSFYNAKEDADIPNSAEMAEYIIDLIDSGDLTRNDLVISLITMGVIVDRERGADGYGLVDQALAVLDRLGRTYGEEELNYARKAMMTCRNMLAGVSLTLDEERYLLSLLERNN